MPQPLPIFDSQHFNQDNSRLNLPISQNHKSVFKVKYYEYSFSSHLTPNSYINPPQTIYNSPSPNGDHTPTDCNYNTKQYRKVYIHYLGISPTTVEGRLVPGYKSNDTTQPAPIHPDVNAVKPNAFPSCLIALKCNPRGCDY
jgi:hypothetical protein